MRFNCLRIHLKKYALTAIFVEACLLASASPAQAKIVYTPANETIPVRAFYNLDLNHDGVTDVALWSGGSVGSCHFSIAVLEIPTAGNGAEGTPPAALNLGDKIGPTQTFYGGSGTMLSVVSDCRHWGTVGNWLNVTNRYLGFSFKINGKTHYGWARMNVQIKGLRIVGTLTGYAYETTPNKSIMAGRTQ